jgi:hypothetical protein
MSNPLSEYGVSDTDYAMTIGAVMGEAMHEGLVGMGVVAAVGLNRAERPGAFKSKSASLGDIFAAPHSADAVIDAVRNGTSLSNKGRQFSSTINSNIPGASTEGFQNLKTGMEAALAAAYDQSFSPQLGIRQDSFERAKIATEVAVKARDMGIDLGLGVTNFGTPGFGKKAGVGQNPARLGGHVVGPFDPREARPKAADFASRFAAAAALTGVVVPDEMVPDITAYTNRGQIMASASVMQKQAQDYLSKELDQEVMPGLNYNDLVEETGLSAVDVPNVTGRLGIDPIGPLGFAENFGITPTDDYTLPDRISPVEAAPLSMQPAPAGSFSPGLPADIFNDVVQGSFPGAGLPQSVPMGGYSPPAPGILGDALPASLEAAPLASYGDPLGFDSQPIAAAMAQPQPQTLEGFMPGPAVEPDFTGGYPMAMGGYTPATAPLGDYATPLGAVQPNFSDVDVGSYPDITAGVYSTPHPDAAALFGGSPLGPAQAFDRNWSQDFDNFSPTPQAASMTMDRPSAPSGISPVGALGMGETFGIKAEGWGPGTGFSAGFGNGPWGQTPDFAAPSLEARNNAAAAQNAVRNAREGLASVERAVADNEKAIGDWNSKVASSPTLGSFDTTRAGIRDQKLDVADLSIGPMASAGFTPSGFTPQSAQPAPQNAPQLAATSEFNPDGNLPSMAAAPLSAPSFVTQATTVAPVTDEDVVQGDIATPSSTASTQAPAKSTNVSTTPDLTPANPVNAASAAPARAASPRSSSIAARAAAPRSAPRAAAAAPAPRAAAPAPVARAAAAPMAAASFPSLAAGLNRGLSLAEVYGGTNYGQSFDQASFGSPGSMSQFGTPFDDLGIAMPHDRYMSSPALAQAFFDKQGQMGILDRLAAMFSGGGMGGQGGSRDTGFGGGVLGDGSFSSHAGHNPNSPQGML